MPQETWPIIIKILWFNARHIHRTAAKLVNTFFFLKKRNEKNCNKKIRALQAKKDKTKKINKNSKNNHQYSAHYCKNYIILFQALANNCSIYTIERLRDRKRNVSQDENKNKPLHFKINYKHKQAIFNVVLTEEQIVQMKWSGLCTRICYTFKSQK